VRQARASSHAGLYWLIAARANLKASTFAISDAKNGPQNAEAILGIVVGDALDEASQDFLG
jgi:hypothetical protein